MVPLGFQIQHLWTLRCFFIPLSCIFRIISFLEPSPSLLLVTWADFWTRRAYPTLQPIVSSRVPSLSSMNRSCQAQGYNTLLLWVGQRSLCAVFHQQDWIIFLFMWYLLLPIILSKTAFCIDVFVASKAFGMSRLCMLIYLTKTAFITFFLQHTNLFALKPPQSQ